MSLTGRKIIDNLKARVGRYLKLPVPPYEQPAYWDGAYRQLDKGRVYEWSGLGLGHLIEHDFKLLMNLKRGKVQDEGSSKDEQDWKETNLLEALGLDGSKWSDEIDDEISTMIVGCGNSEFGEHMLEQDMYKWPGKIVQMDISAKVIDNMTSRCEPYLDRMDLVHDDATRLSAFGNDSIDAAFDKGMVDALYCAEQHDQLVDIMSSVNRVLKPNGMFVLLSYSQPSFILPSLLPSYQQFVERGKDPLYLWDDVEVRQVHGVLMYRFQKGFNRASAQHAEKKTLAKKLKKKIGKRKKIA